MGKAYPFLHLHYPHFAGSFLAAVVHQHKLFAGVFVLP